MYKFIKQKLIILVLVPVCFGKPLAIRSVSMNNRLCMVRQTLIDLNPDELYHYPFIISMNRCNGPCNTAEDPFGGICIPNKVFNMIIGINESKATTLSECRCEFYGRKCNSRQKWENDTWKGRKPIKKEHVKRIIPGIVVHLPANMIRIATWVNT